MQQRSHGARRALTIVLTLILLALGAAAPAHAAAPDIECSGAILIDLDTGQVLYSKNADTQLYPASTTKIMTALVALEMGHLDDVITAGDSVSTVDGSRIYLEPGEQETLNDLLYAMLLPSANDAAWVIAEHYGGTVEKFVELMNEKAAALGATNTHFVTPNGLHDPAHVTTPRDLAIIARAAMANPTFAKIVSTREHDMPWPEKGTIRQLYNLNELLDSYEGALGIKTGFTTPAQHTLVAAVERNGMRLLSVTMHSDIAHRFADAKTLMDWAFASFSKQTVVARGVDAGSMTVRTQRIPLVTVDQITYDGAGDSPQFSTQLVLDQQHGIPRRGQIVGRLELWQDGKLFTSVPVAAAASAKAVPVWAWFVAGGALGTGVRVRQLAVKRRRKRIFAGRRTRR